jgi:hypothetical protein
MDTSFEQDVTKCLASLAGMSLPDAIGAIDRIISVLRVAAVRRAGIEPLPRLVFDAHGMVSIYRGFPRVNDPGLEAINQALIEIAEKAGVLYSNQGDHRD